MKIDEDLLLRRKILRVPYHVVLNNILGLHDVETIIHKTILPENVRVLNVYHCHKTRTFIFDLCHESFNIVRPGCIPKDVGSYYTISQTYDVKARTFDFLKAKDEGVFD